MTELSPQAQAVLDAYWKSPWDPSLQHEDRYAIAAALQAAADQVVPANGSRRNNEIRAELITIAAELEGGND
jgi:hypothetical protein